MATSMPRRIGARTLHAVLVFALSSGASSTLAAATYDIGPGQTYATLGAFTWGGLQPGDTVNIHGQSAHYQEMLVIGGSTPIAGTPSNPITIQGVPGPHGEAAVIDGNGATTSPQFAWVSITYIQGLGTAIVYQASYVTISNLTFTGADSTNSFTNSSGSSSSFGVGAAGLYILGPTDHITVNQCSIVDNGNGLCVNSNNHISSNVLIQYCRIWDNGVIGSYYEHNWYTESLGLTAQFNYFGPTRLNSAGSQFKSRDVGLVFRYNFMDQGNANIPDFQGNLTPYQGNGARKMDMVDIEASALMGHTGDAAYQNTEVYGNTFINDDLQSVDCIHYGGDSGTTANYRAGTLYWYDNTFEYDCDQATFYHAGIFDVDSSATVQVTDSIFHQGAGSRGGPSTSLGFMYNQGNLTFGPSYASPGINDWTYGTPNGTVLGGNGDANSMLIHNASDDPGFVNPAGGDYHLASGSICLGAAGSLNANVLPTNNVVFQYLAPMQSLARTSLSDLGAFAYAAAGTTTTTTSTTTTTTTANGSGTGTSTTGGFSAGGTGDGGSGGSGHCGLGGGVSLLAFLLMRHRRPHRATLPAA